jgi:uncharacterized protein (TIGR03083 family)
MKPVEPVCTVELFPELSAELLRLLKSLPPTAWDLPTACPGWSVKDVVAHLLGGNLGRLSFGRDRSLGPAPQVAPLGYGELVAYINQLNAEWIDAARRISPSLLIDFLGLTEPQLYDYFRTLPPFESRGPAVAWAGDVRSPNWFDIAREYTEKWLHQQHIREAVGQPALDDRKWLYPVLDTFMCALPHVYRDISAAEGIAIVFRIVGAAGGDWSLLRRDHAWRLYAGAPQTAASIVRLDQELAWRLFSKGISPEIARARIACEGDATLGMRIVEMVCIMA